MKITITTKPLAQIQADLSIVPLFEDKPSSEAKEAGGDFKGQHAEAYLIRRVLLLGLGKRKEFTLELLRGAMSASAPIMQKLRIKSLAVRMPEAAPKGSDLEKTAAALIEGLVLAGYRFTQYKNFTPEELPVSLESIEIIVGSSRDKAKAQKGAAAAQTLCESVMFARDLGNHPGNVATPTHLAEHAIALGKTFKSIRVKILERADIVREKMGAFLAVAQGSEEPPKFIILEYSGKPARRRGGDAPTVLVGKGITFDSGGISIKPSEKMEEMKFDMAGAAAVMGILRAAAALKLNINLIGLIPATENLPSGKALKPGDIIRARSGKTIEVVNTDAEGRLVLPDVPDYAKAYNPKLVIDFTTLIGSIAAA